MYENITCFDASLEHYNLNDNKILSAVIQMYYVKCNLYYVMQLCR